MPISNALKGAIVPVGDITNTGFGLNDLVNRNIIAPREGGQKFEFLSDFDFNKPLSPIAGGGGTVDAIGKAIQGLEEIGTSRKILLEKSIADKEAERAGIRERVGAQFKPLFEQAKEEGAMEKGGAELTAGRFRGPGLSSAGMALVERAVDRSNKRLDNLASQMEIAINQANEAAVTRIQDLRIKEIELQQNMSEGILKALESKFNVETKLAEEGRAKELFPAQKAAAEKAAAEPGFAEQQRITALKDLREKFPDAKFSDNSTVEQAYDAVKLTDTYKRMGEKEKAEIDLAKAQAAKARADAAMGGLSSTEISNINRAKAVGQASIRLNDLVDKNGKLLTASEVQKEINALLASGKIYTTDIATLSSLILDRVRPEDRDALIKATQGSVKQDQLQQAKQEVTSLLSSGSKSPEEIIREITRVGFNIKDFEDAFKAYAPDWYLKNIVNF